MYSHAETSCLPGTPPIASTVVPGSFAIAERCCIGSSRKTSVPAGASTFSPSTVNSARPLTTT
jgi:hypothetical protein